MANCVMVSFQHRLHMVAKKLKEILDLEFPPRDC